ncbi:MAG: hypothetical protein LBE30_05735 [Comamonas sp.]|jgi:hypothetical protein|nr:hypothetical protein [Comamonas sp.]
MSSITFTRRMDAHSRCVLSSDVTLPDGRYLVINAARHTGLVELGLSCSTALVSYQSSMAFTPEQARALAAELVACADAHVSGAAMKGGAQ